MGKATDEAQKQNNEKKDDKDDGCCKEDKGCCKEDERCCKKCESEVSDVSTVSSVCMNSCCSKESCCEKKCCKKTCCKEKCCKQSCCCQEDHLRRGSGRHGQDRDQSHNSGHRRGCMHYGTNHDYGHGKCGNECQNDRGHGHGRYGQHYNATHKEGQEGHQKAHDANTPDQNAQVGIQDRSCRCGQCTSNYEKPTLNDSIFSKQHLTLNLDNARPNLKEKVKRLHKRAKLPSGKYSRNHNSIAFN